MTYNDLEIKSVKELRGIAKDLEIVGRWDKTKGELITAILLASSEEEPEATAESKEEIGNKPNEVTIPTPAIQEVVSDNVEEELNESQVIAKHEYIYQIQKDALIAFKVDGKVKSAMVTNKSSARKVLKAENKQGKEYIVNYEDILWVKTSRRWPKGIYILLKGGNDDGAN